MAPVPRILSSPLPLGQATLNLQGLLQPPKPRPRHGRPAKDAPNRSQRVLGRRYIGGIAEQELIRELAQWRIQYDEDRIGEPGDQERAIRPIEEGGVDDDIDGLADSEYDDYVTRRRYSYSREYKLAALSYWETTYRKLKDGTDECITIRFAARKLCIPRTTFRGWIQKKDKILGQKKGTFRVRKPWGKVKELEMELKLKERFDEARLKGRAISAKWLIRNARQIYSELHPERVIRREGGMNLYLGFRWSPGWLTGFKHRHGVSFRAGTKRAQKAPEELRSTIVSWLQFNRRNTIVTSDSDCGKPRPATVPVVGRYKLSEIANMDQTPLAFEFQKGRTYASTGDRTVTLRTARGGWEKRQATLQVIVFADGVNRCKPLLIFKGKPGRGNKNRRLEMSKYHPGVKVIWNEKAYANSSNLIDWIRHDYSHASEYPLSDHEPRLLVLDAFAPHKHTGKKVPAVESEKAKARRLQEERLNDTIRAEFARLNVTLSLIPGGCTGYVQVLDVAINSLLKAIIKELEEVHIDQHLEQWNNNEYTVADRRVLLTHWVGEAWRRIHTDYRETIIKTFRNLGLSLTPDGSEDSELKIRDLPNITIGDYTSSSTNPTSIDDDDELEGDTIVVQGTYIGVEETYTIPTKNENDVTTDTGNDTESAFDSDSEFDSSEEEEGDMDIANAEGE